MSELWKLSALDLASAIRTGDTTSRERNRPTIHSERPSPITPIDPILA